MNKKQFIMHVAKENLINKDEAIKIVDVFLKSLVSGLPKDGEIHFLGVCRFISQRMKAREGRNPKTGKPLKIKAYNQVKFKAGILLKESCNAKGAKALEKKRGLGGVD